jgi:hypothetical protein
MCDARDNKKGGRRLVALLFCIGILQIAGYYLAGALARPEGGFAIPQRDTLLYCQAARRIAEGSPFSFSAGELPCTGTTSHLYPFILSVPYVLGMKGDSLFVAGFVVNALFYLIFLCCWGVVINHKLHSHLARVTAVLSLGLMGQPAFSAFSQTDIGFWMAASSMLAVGFALRQPLLYGCMLVVSPWIRPEGMYIVLSFAIALCIARQSFWRQFDNSSRRVDLFILIFGIVSAMGVFAFNYWLTGAPGFSSLAHKGHLATKPFARAVYATVSDLMVLSKSFLLGIPKQMPRDICFLPVVGAVLFWSAVLCRNWRRECDWREIAWFLSLGVGFVAVAQSGMQDVNVDRYLTWELPTIAIVMSGGTGVVAEALSKRKFASIVPSALLVSFALVSACTHIAMLSMTSEDSDLKCSFAKRCDAVMEPGASVGSWTGGGIYEMSERRLAQLSGVYSPEFKTSQLASGVPEILKNEPATRFNYLLVEPRWRTPGDDDPLSSSEQVIVGPAGAELRRMDWTPFDAAAVVPKVSNPNARFVTRVDVGYDRDEAASRYLTIPLYERLPPKPFALLSEKNGEKMCDSGRVVVGMDEMTVSLCTNRDVYVVMRTYPCQKISLEADPSMWSEYAFANPLRLNVSVDGIIVSQVSLRYADKGFSDVEFVIPGTAIKSSVSRIAFLGDHITCGYWFFQ